jgi:hypothetical protein
MSAPGRWLTIGCGVVCLIVFVIVAVVLLR